MNNIDVISINELIENIKDNNKEVIILGEATSLYKEDIKNINNINIAPNSHSTSLPFFKTAAEVSSQLVSIAKVIMSFI